MNAILSGLKLQNHPVHSPTAVVALVLCSVIGSTSNAQEETVLKFKTIKILPRSFTYRQLGEYLQLGRPVSAPLIRSDLKQPLHVMEQLVTRLQYQQCVDAGACAKPFEAYSRMDGSTKESDWGEPQTGVNFHDAQAFAEWIKQQTGENWRLPSDLEWAAFAAERYFDDQPGSPGDPLKASISAPRIYKFQAGASELLSADYYDPIPQEAGAFGANSLGVFDISGNISEWTSSCYQRNRLNEHGEQIASEAYCGVRIVEGRQRSYMSTFLRDPSSGECTPVIPTLNLGIRLVRDDQESWFKIVSDWLQ